MVFESLHLTRLNLIMCGIWQIGIYMSCQQIFPIFMNYTPKWSCEQSDDIKEWSKNCSVLMDCQAENLTLEPAPFYSAVEEFQMFCGGPAYFAALVSTLQFVGVLVGTITLGHLGDRFGRKKITVLCLALGFGVCCASGASPNWQILAALRFLVGFCLGGVIVVGFSYVIELLLPEQRLFLRLFFNWGNGRILFTFICYLVPHWRYAAGVTVVPLLLMLLLIVVLVPESPRWLQSRKKHEQAIKVLKRIADFNRKKFNEEILEPLNDDMTTPNRMYTICDLFVNRKMTKLTITLCFIWFTASLSSYASDLTSRNLAGDFYLNQFLIAIMIALSKYALFFMDTYNPKFSRRLLHQVPQTIVCICYIAIMIMIVFEFSPIAITTINIIGIVFIEYTWDACYLCAAEGFPTVVRSIGVGTCSLMARVGAIFAPQMTYLSNMWKGAPFAAVFVCGFGSLILSYMYLPETKGRELDDLLLQSTQEQTVKDPHEGKRHESSSL